MAAQNKIGDVDFHPFSKQAKEPFGLYVEGNSIFDEYDNIPLTCFELTQKVISEAANSYKVPVWFTFCVNEDGKRLPFSSTPSRLPDGLSVPVILNGKLLEVDDTRYRTWPAIVKIPTEDGGYLLKQVFIRYERGSIISAHDVYGCKHAE